MRTNMDMLDKEDRVDNQVKEELVIVAL